MTDITNRIDIDIILRSFYQKLLLDKRIAYIFTDVAKIDLEKHLPIIGDFWEMVLFQTGNYQKNVLRIHQDLNQQSPITKEHFQIWLYNFNLTIDELYQGDNATIAKQRAQSVATVMQIKFTQ